MGQEKKKTMGLKQCFKGQEMMAIPASDGSRCSVCRKRIATWMAEVEGEEDAEPMCGYCAMYSGRSVWGQRNRQDNLHVGRAAQAHALVNGKAPPEIDERGRLDPDAAERFILGVATTTRLQGRLAKML